MKSFYISFFCYLVLILNPNPAAASNFDAAGINNSQEFEVFYRSIQENLKNQEWSELVDKVKLPITLRVGQEKYSATTKEELFSSLKTVFTSDFKDAILCQNVKSLKSNYQGVRGSIWMNLVYIGSEKYNPKLHSERNNRNIWQYKITALRNSYLVGEYLKNCLPEK